MTQKEKDLYILLSAENMISWEKSLRYRRASDGKEFSTHQAMHPRSIEAAIKTATNQYEFDTKISSFRSTLFQQIQKSSDRNKIVHGIRKL